MVEAIAFVIGLCIGFMFANRMAQSRIDEISDQYNSLVDRDPKTGRFVKSMRTIKNED
jgi:hypothetical protein